jgi:omega-6 fatty acid desaturase (delta-12 desaturase)
MRVFGVFAISPSSIWRSSHNHHHNHNSKLRGSHIGSFPIMTRAQFESSSLSERRQYLAIRHPLTILGGYFSMFLLGMCVVPFFHDPRKHLDCLAALLVHVGLGVALVLTAGWQQLLLTQTVPYFIASAMGCYLFYVQHNFPTVALEEKAGWTYEKAALESSSFLKTSRIMGWFTANIGYHHIHHLNSKIPFYRLPEVMAKMPELQKPRVTSLNPFDIARCLRLKVWDADRQRMIGFKEMAEVSGSTAQVAA